jgi:hypothetical protein
MVLGDIAKHHEAVAVGKAHVGEREVVLAQLQRLFGLLERRRGVGVDTHAREREHQELADVGFIIDDEHGFAVHHAPFRMMRKCPWPEPSTYSMRAPLPSQSSRAM